MTIGSVGVGAGVTIDSSEAVDINSGLTSRYNRIKQQIDEIGGDPVDDKLEGIDDEVLDGELAKFLLENINALNALKDSVKTIKTNKKLAKKAGEKAVKKLSDFLDNLANNEKLEKDYKKFVDRLSKPKDLHKMKEKDIARVKLYLSMHESEALEIYRALKKIDIVNGGATGIRQEDIDVCNEIMQSLRINYGRYSDFIEEDYPGYKALSSKSETLKSFLGDVQWNGENITVDYLKDIQNSVVDKEWAVEFFNLCNVDRIRFIEQRILNTNFTLPLDEFTKSTDGTLNFRGQPFTADVMIQNFIEELASQISGCDFVNENVEKPDLIRKNKDKIYNKICKFLLLNVSQDSSSSNSTDTLEGSVETGTEQATSSLKYSARKEDIKIKDPDLAGKIVDNLKFCDSLDGEEVQFDISEVRNYLDGIKDVSRKDLNTMQKLDRETWVIAVQIALKYLNEKEGDYKDNCDVRWMDGIYKQRTRGGVEGFQKVWDEKHPDDKIGVDKWSGPKTITRIVEVLSSDLGSLNGGELNGEGISEGRESGYIQRELDSLKDVANSELELSYLDYLSKEQADQIVMGVTAKLSEENQGKMILKLNGLATLDSEVAEKLSELKGVIMIDKIMETLNGNNFEDSDVEITKLKTLTKVNLKILVQNDEIKTKLIERDVMNVELLSNQSDNAGAQSKISPEGGQE